jgi:Bacterial Ig-like domain (group 3)/FG-GAP-like repeat
MQKESAMRTRKPSTEYFIALLIVLTTVTVLAQRTNPRQAAKTQVVVSRSATSESALDVRRPLPGVANREPIPVSRMRRMAPDASFTTGNPLSFLPAVVYNSGGDSSQSIAIADVNGDAKPDIVVANLCAKSRLDKCAHGLVDGSVDVLLGNGDGTFLPAVSYGSHGLQALSVAVADINEDGKPDLIVANRYACANSCPDGSVVVRLGNGDGTFQSAVAYDSGGCGTWSVAVADVDGDGKRDIVAANNCSGSGGTSSTVGVLLGKGDGTFQPAVTYAAGVNAWSIAVADIDGDGKPDLMIGSCASSDCATGTVTVLLNKGDGTFQTPVSYDSGGSQGISVAVADVNGDGKPDLLIANYFSASIGVLLGKGDGTFLPVVTYNSGGKQPNSVAVADVNGDNKPDLIVANLADGPSVLLGNGDGTFQTARTYAPGGVNPLAIAAADLNVDGQLDLVVGESLGIGNTDGGVAVLINNTLLPHETKTTLVSSPNPSFSGQAVVFSATVGTRSGAPPNGEIVTFNDGSAILGTGSLIGGVALLTTSTLPVGTATITASYPGDANFTASQSAGLSQVVTPPNKFPTSTALVSSLNPSIYGQNVTWTATVTTSGSITPTGKVNFTSDGVGIGTATLNASGVATISKRFLNASAFPVTAVYRGDASNLRSTSNIVNQVVEQATSAATISSSPNPSSNGQIVTFTVRITSPTVTPSGPVTFTSGKTVVGTAQLKGGKATFSTSTLPVGSDKITVTFSGNSNIAASMASLTQTVQ